jgi:hypothetical protein
VHPAADRLTSAVAVAVALDLRRRAERPTFATRRRSSAGDERSFRGGPPCATRTRPCAASLRRQCSIVPVCSTSACRSRRVRGMPAERAQCWRQPARQVGVNGPTLPDGDRRLIQNRRAGAKHAVWLSRFPSDERRTSTAARSHNPFASLLSRTHALPWP